MTPSALRRALEARSIDWPDDPGTLLATVEARAEAHPGDPAWTALLLASELFHTASVPLPRPYRAERLVRFDALSATWTARDATSRYLIRAPRPHASAVQRRLIERDARALKGLVEGTLEEGAFVVNAPGAPLDGSSVGPAVVLAGGLTALSSWLKRGFAPPPPHPEEIRVVEGRVQLLSLTPGTRSLQGWLSGVLPLLRGSGTLLPLLDGLAALPPTSLADAEERLRKAMHQDLTERAVALRTRSQQADQLDRRGRFVELVTRLQAAVPAPRGKGAVGFDLDARPTQVISDDQGLRFGPVGEEQPFYTDAFEAPAARRFLRACLSAPTNDDLHQQLQTDPAFTDAIGRWVAAGLKLRTVRLLLEKT